MFIVSLQDAHYYYIVLRFFLSYKNFCILFSYFFDSNFYFILFEFYFFSLIQFFGVLFLTNKFDFFVLLILFEKKDLFGFYYGDQTVIFV